MLPTHDVDCPKCGKALYTALSLEDVVAADSPASPRILHNGRGDYVRCPHCGERVPMKRVATSSGDGYRIADKG